MSVLVKPNSKKESITADESGTLTVRVHAPPVDGQANKRVIELLSDYFKRPKSAIQLLHGTSGKKKIFEIS